MNYCILGENNVIENIIVCGDGETAALFGAVASYEGARIGYTYDPPPGPEPQATDTEGRNALRGVSE